MHHLPPIPQTPAAYRKGKSGQQTEILINQFKQNVFYPTDFQLRISPFGTKYISTNIMWIFFESDIFDDHLKRYAYTVGLAELTNSTIDYVKSVLRADDSFWTQDSDTCHNGSIRIIQHGVHSYYLLDKGRYISLNLNLKYINDPIAFLISSKSKGVFLEDPNKVINYPYIQSLPDIPNKLHHTYELLHSLGIPDKYQLMMVTWLIHVLLAREPVLLQIIENHHSHASFIANTLKGLIDPSSEECISLPRKEQSILKCGLDNYVLHFSVAHDEKLSGEQQNTLLHMTTQKGMKTNASTSRKFKAECLIKRPIILSTYSDVIDLPSLQSRCISIELDFSEFTYQLNTQVAQRVNVIRNELLECATYIATHKLYSLAEGYSFTSRFPELCEFLMIGYYLDNLINPGSQRLMFEFNQYLEESMFAQLQGEGYRDIAFLLFQWAKQNIGMSKTQPIIHWHHTLRRVASEHDLSIDDISYRKLGAIFKKAKPTLEKLGINLTSSIGCNRYCEWTVTTEQEIGVKNKLTVQNIISQ